MNIPNLYTAQEVAEILHLSRGTIYCLVSRGEIDSVKFGRARRFTQQHINDYIHRDRQVVIDATQPMFRVG